MPPSSDFAAFQNVLRSSRKIIAVVGAGLSAASGIPTFRGAGGLWRKHDAMSLATPEAFDRSPSLVWQFYHYRRESALKANPNDAHLLLAAFALPSIRDQIVPKAQFHIITQNVDGLSARAQQQLAPLQTAEITDNPLIEMHGRLFDVVCTDSSCGHREFNTTSPVCEGLAGTEQLIEMSETDPAIDPSALPRCSQCGALARPGVVWFSEMPHHLDVIDAIVGEADLCLVIGTSSMVFPAASYAQDVFGNGGTVAIFNIEKTPIDEVAGYLFRGPCEETLSKALGISVSVANGKTSVQLIEEA